MQLKNIGENVFISDVSDDNTNYVVVADKKQNSKFIVKDVPVSKITDIAFLLKAQYDNNLYKSDRYQIIAILTKKFYDKMVSVILENGPLDANIISLLKLGGLVK